MNVKTIVENRLIYSVIAVNAALGTIRRFQPMFTPRFVKTERVVSETD